MAWRVTPTTDLGKPLDLLLHPPSEKEEEGRLGGRRGRPGKKKLGRGEEANRKKTGEVGHCILLSGDHGNLE